MLTAEEYKLQVVAAHALIELTKDGREQDDKAKQEAIDYAKGLSSEGVTEMFIRIMENKI